MAAAAPAFDADGYVRAALRDGWTDLALEQRMRRLSELLGQRLPGAYRRQFDVPERIAPDFTGLTALLFPNVVSFVFFRKVFQVTERVLDAGWHRWERCHASPICRRARTTPAITS